jgi:hypothetical protein
METSTPNGGPTDTVRILEAQIREVFGRTVYDHKTHEKCADQYLAKHRAIKLVTIVLSALTTTSILLALWGDSRPRTVIGAILSAALFGLTTYTKDFDFGELSQRHADTATRLLAVREAYFSLLTDLAGGLVHTDDILKERNRLQHILDTIHKGAPRTTPKAYEAAQKALQENQELTFSDQEIDAFLPVALRRGSSTPPTGEV